MKKSLFIAITIITIFASCGNKTAQGEGGDTLKLKYARLLTIVKHNGYTTVDIANPWYKGKVLHKYVLVPSDRKVPDDISHDGTVIRTPLKRSIVFTTVHCALIQNIGARSSIAGVCDLKYIKIPWIQQQCNLHKIADCGEGMGPNIEKIIDTKPDAILLSPFQNSGGYGKLEEIGVPLIECADYMEYSALGRAEWMKLYGLLYGCEQKADSLFNVVDSCYKAGKSYAGTLKSHPIVLMDKITGSVWYVPGGESTMGQIIKDAGGKYVFAGDKHSGSTALPFETVLAKAGNADVWLTRDGSPESLNKMLTENAAYAQFNAYKRKNVYSCNVEDSKFYEESPFRPDYLLQDFIRIFHPESNKQVELKYFYLVK